MAWGTEQTSNREIVSDSRVGYDKPVAQHRRLWRTLRQRADFLRVRASGIQNVTPGFILQAAPRHSARAPNYNTAIHIGFTASKKVGNAVCRNRVKRRLRALADKVMAREASMNFDYVLVGRAQTLTRGFALMEQDLQKSLQRIQVRAQKTVAEKTLTVGISN